MRAFWVLAGVYLAASVGLGDYIGGSGNLRHYLKFQISVRSDVNAFVQPSAAEQAAFRDGVRLLLEQNFSGSADVVDPLGYDVIQYSDSVTGGVYYILQERLAWRGLGTYVFNPRASRTISVQVPHPVVDQLTWSQGVDIFMDTDAAFFQIAGTRRCTNTTFSNCDGTTTTCSSSAQAYRVSDVAHWPFNFYQMASNEAHDSVEPLVSISVHGFGCSTQADALDTSIAQISNGNTADVPNSLATRLAIAYNGILFATPINYGGRGAGSFNRMPSEPADLQAGGCVNFSGGTNVQGRYINGQTLDPCTTAFTQPVAVERFLHLEQQLPLRGDMPDSSGLSRQVTIDALSDLFVPEMWVDFDHPGSEFGSWFRPYDTLGEGAANSSAGQVVRVRAGNLAEVVTISDPIEIRSYGGTATIGR